MGIGREKFMNVDRVLGWHPGRGYTGGQRNPRRVDALPSGLCHRDSACLLGLGQRKKVPIRVMIRLGKLRN